MLLIVWDGLRVIFSAQSKAILCYSWEMAKNLVYSGLYSNFETIGWVWSR